MDNEKVNLANKIREFLDKYRENDISLYIEDLSNGYTQMWSESPMRYIKSWSEDIPKTTEITSSDGFSSSRLRKIVLYCVDLSLLKRNQYIITLNNDQIRLYYNTKSNL